MARRLPMANGNKDRCAPSGFTLTETLVAMLILVLATGIVAMGVDVARRNYVQMQFESQAEVLSGTINNALSDPFRFLQDNGGTLSIMFNGDTITGPELVTEDGMLHIKGAGSKGAVDQMLINKGAYGNCQVSIDKLAMTSGEVSGSYTITTSSDANLSRSYNFCFVPNTGVDRKSRSDSNSGGSVTPDTPNRPEKPDTPSKAPDSEAPEGYPKITSAQSELCYKVQGWKESEQWYLEDSYWVELHDAQGVKYYGISIRWNHQRYCLVYYRGTYYQPFYVGRSRDQIGSQVATELPITTGVNSGFTPFSVAQLSTNDSYNYGDDPVQWNAVQNG